MESWKEAHSVMNHLGPNVMRIFLGLALILSSSGHATNAQKKKNNCGRPPKIISQPKFSDEDRARWKGKSVSGRVAIVVSEEGDVTQARVVSASPREAAESILNAAKVAKFEPRHGCGELKSDIFFNPSP
jgi:outer membrane biosynthesis protein TonB